MAINFPSNPTDGSFHTDAGTTWVFSSANNSWTVTSTSSPGISNGTNYENSLVILDNVGGSPTKNLPVAAQGLEFHPTDKRLTIKMVASPTIKPFAILDSTNAELNAFNVRGILDKAGRIYYSSTTPTVNSNDTGQLWYDTGNNALKISNSSATFDTVVSASNFVTLSTEQSITAIKTFTAVPVFAGGINITGGNLALNNGCTIGTGAASGYSFVNNPTFSGNPIFSGNATFTGATSARLTGSCEDLRIDPSSGTTSRIICSTSTNSLESSNNLQLSPNKSDAGRKIVIYNNASSDQIGISIKPSNGNNAGRLQVEGNTTVVGNLSVTGGTVSFPSNSYIPGLSTFGSVKNSLAGAYGQTVAPSPIGPLTFAVDGIDLRITNTSSSPVSFYLYKRIESAGGGTTLGSGASAVLNYINGSGTNSTATTAIPRFLDLATTQPLSLYSVWKVIIAANAVDVLFYAFQFKTPVGLLNTGITSIQAIAIDDVSINYPGFSWAGVTRNSIGLSPVMLQVTLA